MQEKKCELSECSEAERLAILKLSSSVLFCLANPLLLGVALTALEPPGDGGIWAREF